MNTIFTLIRQEQQRQESTINLIASENYAPLLVREAMASVLSNKYAEGYPGKRYYAGCAIVDQVEQRAQELCQKLFNAEHVNVQPHSGSQANMAAYHALLQPGDTIMGMSLAHGGHLTHGHNVNFSGKLYTIIPYTVNRDTELLDYAYIRTTAHRHKPKLIIAGASAYSRHIDFQQFGTIAKEVGAYLLTDIAHIAGLIAVGLHPSPIHHADIITSTTHKTLRGPRGGLIMSKKKYASAIDRAIMPGTQGGPFMHNIAAKAVAFQLALTPEFTHYQQKVIKNAQLMAQLLTQEGYRIVSDGTDNHLFIVDLRANNITGQQAEYALQKAGITVSRSCIPFDPEKPWITSGIRLGTPAITTRAMGSPEIYTIVAFIKDALQHHDNGKKLQIIRKEVKTMCASFPISQHHLHSSTPYEPEITR